MLQLKINGELVEVKEGTRVIDLLADDEKCNYMVCKLGTQVKELNRKLSEKDLSLIHISEPTRRS